MIDFARFKRFFLYCLIGALIVSAIVAVIVVLIGEFNDLALKVLLTLLMVIMHSLVSLIFIWDDEKQNTFERLSFFINVVFFVIVLSFITSLFGIWKVISAEQIINLYELYGVIIFAALHGDILSKALKKEGYIDKIIYSNYFMMVIVIIMLTAVIFVNNPFDVLGENFFRILGAAGIIDGTLSVLTIIFYKLYINKHPEEKNPLAWGHDEKGKKKGLNIWVWILMIYLILQVILPLLFLGVWRIASLLK